MRPSTRSRSGAPRDHDGGLIKGGSKVEVSGPVQIKQKTVVAEQVAAELLGQQDSSDDNEVSSHESSSGESDGGIGRIGKSGVKRGPNSELLKEDGGLVADQVFVGLPQSNPGAGDVNQNVDATVRGKEKAEGDVLKAPWVNLFRDNRNLGKGIKLDAFEEDGDMVLIEEEDVDVVEEAWGYCLVGQFAGRFPGLAAVHSLKEGWKVKCTHWIHRSGWIVFKFLSEEDRLKVLDGGPYFAYGRNLMLKIMPRCFRFGGEDVAIIPVWIQLPDLPLDCWNARALSKIASRVGKPITTDKLTRTKERLSFARVMVEVDASKELVTTVEMRLPTGEVYHQLVVFEFIPKYCRKCKTFGHVEGDCNKESVERKYSAFMPKRKLQAGGVTARSNEAMGAVKGGARELIGKTKMAVDSSAKSGAPSAGVGQSTPSGMAPGTLLVSDAPSVVVDLVGSSAVRSVKGVSMSCGLAREVLGSVQVPGNSDVAEGQVEGVSGMEPPAPALNFPAEDLAARVKGGARHGNKGRHKKAAGQRPVTDVQMQSVDLVPCLRPVEGGLSRRGSQLLTSADRDKEGLEGFKIGSGTGGGGSLNSAQTGSVVQCLRAVAAESVSRNWAEECEAGEGVDIALDQMATCSPVPKVKLKGKALQPSK